MIRAKTGRKAEFARIEVMDRRAKTMKNTDTIGKMSKVAFEIVEVSERGRATQAGSAGWIVRPIRVS